MNIDQARRASTTLEDVFTADEFAVVIDRLYSSRTGGGNWARVTGAGPLNPYFETWVPIDTLTAKEDIR